MIKEIVKRGNSNYVLIDAELLKLTGLNTGDKLDVNFDGINIILTLVDKNVDKPTK